MDLGIKEIENNNKSYSLYRYEPGTLKVFGNTSTRQKYESFDDAVEAARKRVDFLKKHRLGYKGMFDNLQIVIVEYDNSYKSKIVGIISNDGDIQNVLFEK